MVCLIGGNEAGKSSVFELLSGARHTSAIGAKDRTRRETVEDQVFAVTLSYRLEDSDLDRVRDYFGDTPLPTRFTVKKQMGGAIVRSMDRNPRRDRAHRLSLVTQLGEESVSESANPSDEEDAVTGPLSVDEKGTLIEALREDVETLATETLAELDAHVNALREAGEMLLADTMEDLAIHERQPHPSVVAEDALWNASPDFVLFAGEDRNLNSEYDIQTAATTPPRALSNLISLADLDMAELVRAIDQGESGTVEDIEKVTNQRLSEVFDRWTQRPPITVTIKLAPPTLNIHVRTGVDVPMRLEERSDGLKTFVALVAATAQMETSVPPILLIDEIETHLHYDAQVDLLRILANQTQATATERPKLGQIIYSTHSAACLPDDLSNVRIVSAVTDRTRSTFRNHFWTDRPGLAPLLMAMGAASLAFVPRRAALIAEGPSELILLPTLIKQALELEHLGYQIAPGASGVRPGTIIGLNLEAPRTAWVVDSDRGGAAIAKKLRDDGIADERILFLGGDGAGLVLEALVEPAAYRDAVAAYLRDKGEYSAPALGELGTDPSRVAAGHCTSLGIEPPSKVVIANRLVAMRGERQLFSEIRRGDLTKLHEKARALLGNLEEEMLVDTAE
jgi:hypothetical protein